MSFESPPSATPSAPRQVVLSPEQVALELPIAGPTSRIFAFTIDLALMIALQGVIALAVIYLLVNLFDLSDWLGIGENGNYQFNAEIDGESTSRILMIAQAVFVLVEFAVQWGYFVCFELLMQGRSPGKAVAGLRVVCDGGLPIGFRESAIRNLVRFVDMLPTAYLVGLVAMVNPKPDQLVVRVLLPGSKWLSKLLTADVVANLLLNGALHAAIHSASGRAILAGLMFNSPSSLRSGFSVISSFRPVKSPSILKLENLALSLPVVCV